MDDNFVESLRSNYEKGIHGISKSGFLNDEMFFQLVQNVTKHYNVDRDGKKIKMKCFSEFFYNFFDVKIRQKTTRTFLRTSFLRPLAKFSRTKERWPI